jgi:hypothetical protein
MKIIVCYTKEGNIRRIDDMQVFLDKGRTEKEILDAAEEQNSNPEKYGGARWEFIDVPENLVHPLAFLLGKDKYKRCSNIDDLLGQLDTIKDLLEEVSTDVYDCSDYLREMIQDVKKVARDEEDDE